MPACIVPSCSNSDQNYRKKSRIQSEIEKNTKVTFHRLPRNEERKKAWLKSLQICEPINEAAVVCSLHFNKKDNNRTLDSTILREEAMPTYFSFDDVEDADMENKEDNQQFSHLDVFSSEDLQPSKRLKDSSNFDRDVESQGFHNSVSDEMLLDECRGENDFELVNDNYSDDIIEEFSPSNSGRATPTITSRATSMSPKHFEEKERIRQLEEVILQQTQRESINQKNLKNLKRKLARREALIADLRKVFESFDICKLYQAESKDC